MKVKDLLTHLIINTLKEIEADLQHELRCAQAASSPTTLPLQLCLILVKAECEQRQQRTDT